jgi:acetyl esterase/lipase
MADRATIGKLTMLLAAFLGGCSPARLLDAVVPADGYRLVGNRAYAEGERHGVDVYLPTAPAPRAPVVVFFYGGDWRSGDKATYRFVGQALASRGIVAVIPDYRLYPAVRFPDFLADGAAAVAWTRAHAGEFGGDPRRLFLMGHSAGAYIALMLALDERWLAAAGLDARRDLRGAIGLAGPYDFLPFDADTGPIFGAAPDPAATQPIRFVDGREAPLLLVTGLADATVRPRNTTTLGAEARALGGRAEVRLYPGVGHVELIVAFAAPFRFLAPALDDVVRFVEAAGADRLDGTRPGRHVEGAAATEDR